jgi:metal-responsive CopG/Arc/MetJ family transcriptional regulator
MEDHSVPTTLNLPSDILAATDRVVHSGKAKSRDEFVVLALRHELAALQRAEIDRWASSRDYQALLQSRPVQYSNKAEARGGWRNW